MKIVLFASFLLLITCCFAHYNVVLFETPDDPATLFVQFMIENNKKYSSVAEQASKFATFQDNIDRVIKLNIQANGESLFGLNQFADLSLEEFKAGYLSEEMKRDEIVDHFQQAVYSDDMFRDLPEAYDWNEHGAVTYIKNQGLCGSCWSFSTTGNVEGRWFLAGNDLVALSEQNLVDCDHECMEYQNYNVCDSGCNGGLMPNALNYIVKHGIESEDSYPYAGTGGQCEFDPANIEAKISGFEQVTTTKNETELQAYLYKNGPVAIAVDAETWQFYIKGVFTLPCGEKLDHGVLLTGWGVHTTVLHSRVPYWVVKNSWGPGWGEKGFIWLKRGDDKCAVADFPWSAII